MSLDPVKRNYNWNYSNPNKEGYSTELIGTVLAIQEVQAREYTRNGQPGAPAFWPEGRPKMNIRIVMACPMNNGTIDLKTFTFQKAGKEAREGHKKSIHMDLFDLTGKTGMSNLIGKTIILRTQEGNWGNGNPRPFDCELSEAGPYNLPFDLPPEFKMEQVLCNEAAHGGQTVAPQMQQNAYQQMYNMQANAVQQPMQSQPFMQQQAMAAPVMQMQPTQMHPIQMVQPTTPQGMDPNVAAAMQQLNATNVQPVTPYDDQIPF